MASQCRYARRHWISRRDGRLPHAGAGAYPRVCLGPPGMGRLLVLGPKETAALFTWLVYGVYLHTRSLRGWRGQRSAIILIIGFIAVAFTYYGNYFFGGLHAYGGVN